jgi:ADP-heptose:LPS heptosyltransferase
MASGRARKLYQENKLPVLILGWHGTRAWSDLWDGLPYIVRRPAGRRYQTIVDGSGVRPYIAAKTAERWTWKPYGPAPAQIAFTPAELAFAEPYRGMVMVEPNVKATGHTNKAWSWGRWQEVVLAMPEVRFVQCVAANSANHLALVHRHVVTPTFRHACAVLSVCRAFVGTEGGLMHAAAAVGTPAVILWSEFISPDITGYVTHRNIRHAGPACGMRTDCPGCRASVEAISVDEVVHNLKEILE